MNEWEWEDLLQKTYRKPPTFLEMSQFKKNYFGGVYLTSEEHDLVIARQRSMSWKEQSDSEGEGWLLAAKADEEDDQYPNPNTGL